MLHLSSQLFELTTRLRERVSMRPDARVLDAGASDALFLHAIGAARGVGLNMLPACARQIRAGGFASALGDVERLPFADGAFDFVICCQTIEHVPNPIHTIGELLRVARERVFLTVPWMRRTRINPRAAGWPAIEEHIFEFDERDFATILTHVGARVVHRGAVQVFPEPVNPVARWWLQTWMYGGHFPRLQYWELAPAS